MSITTLDAVPRKKKMHAGEGWGIIIIMKSHGLILINFTIWKWTRSYDINH